MEELPSVYYQDDAVTAGAEYQVLLLDSGPVESAGNLRGYEWGPAPLGVVESFFLLSMIMQWQRHDSDRDLEQPSWFTTVVTL